VGGCLSKPPQPPPPAGPPPSKSVNKQTEQSNPSKPRKPETTKKEEPAPVSSRKKSQDDTAPKAEIVFPGEKNGIVFPKNARKRSTDGSRKKSFERSVDSSRKKSFEQSTDDTRNKNVEVAATPILDTMPKLEPQPESEPLKHLENFMKTHGIGEGSSEIIDQIDITGLDSLLEEAEKEDGSSLLGYHQTSDSVDIQNDSILGYDDGTSILGFTQEEERPRKNTFLGSSANFGHQDTLDSVGDTDDIKDLRALMAAVAESTERDMQALRHERDSLMLSKARSSSDFNEQDIDLLKTDDEELNEFLVD